MDEKGNDGIDMDDEPEVPKSEEEVADRPAKHITLAEKTVGTRSDKGIRQYVDAPAERAVSYTHLDVYKRQTIRRGAFVLEGSGETYPKAH